MACLLAIGIRKRASKPEGPTSENPIQAKFAELFFPEGSEEDHQVLPTSTCQRAPLVSTTRNRSSGVLENRGICNNRSAPSGSPYSILYAAPQDAGFRVGHWSGAMGLVGALWEQGYAGSRIWSSENFFLRGWVNSAGCRVHGLRASFRHRPARHFSSAGRAGRSPRDQLPCRNRRAVTAAAPPPLPATPACAGCGWRRCG